MKKIIALGFALAISSGSALANHTTGLEAHRAQAARAAQAQTSVGVTLPSGVGAYVATGNTHRNIVSDPESCLRKYGDHCVQADHEPVELDLGDTDLSEQDLRTKTTE